MIWPPIEMRLPCHEMRVCPAVGGFPAGSSGRGGGGDGPVDCGPLELGGSVSALLAAELGGGGFHSTVARSSCHVSLRNLPPAAH